MSGGQLVRNLLFMTTVRDLHVEASKLPSGPNKWAEAADQPITQGSLKGDVHLMLQNMESMNRGKQY